MTQSRIATPRPASLRQALCQILRVWLVGCLCVGLAGLQFLTPFLHAHVRMEQTAPGAPGIHLHGMPAFVPAYQQTAAPDGQSDYAHQIAQPAQVGEDESSAATLDNEYLRKLTLVLVVGLLLAAAWPGLCAAVCVALCALLFSLRILIFNRLWAQRVLQAALESAQAFSIPRPTAPPLSFLR